MREMLASCWYDRWLHMGPGYDVCHSRNGDSDFPDPRMRRMAAVM